MKKNYRNIKIFILLTLFVLVFFGQAILVQDEGNFKKKSVQILYTGEISHIFFHSLIIYPDLASNIKGKAYRDYMITQQEFKKILPLLYQNNFVLINIHSIYQVDQSGNVLRAPLYLPKGKKPLIISLDDLSYDASMVGHGFANKLILDQFGNVATEITTKDKKLIITRDGDVVPILDDFIGEHPDFSINGAKGIIGLTGFSGILGYKTDNSDSLNYQSEINQAKLVVAKLKSTGWVFANHSFSHDQSFLRGAITLDELKTDTKLWKEKVESLVGSTDIYIGPFGQIFPTNDTRRAYLVEQGYKMISGVGMDRYIQYFPNYIAMNRADIDGIRLFKTPYLLKNYFNPQLVISADSLIF